MRRRIQQNGQEFAAPKPKYDLRKQGWRWTEEYIWHKRNCYPGKWPNRFRDAWERCLHFSLQKDFAMYQDEVRVPMGDWRHSRLRNLSETDKQRDNSRVQSGFGKNARIKLRRAVEEPGTGNIVLEEMPEYEGEADAGTSDANG